MKTYREIQSHGACCGVGSHSQSPRARVESAIRRVYGCWSRAELGRSPIVMPRWVPGRGDHNLIEQQETIVSASVSRSCSTCAEVFPAVVIGKCRKQLGTSTDRVASTMQTLPKQAGGHSPHASRSAHSARPIRPAWNARIERFTPLRAKPWFVFGPR